MPCWGARCALGQVEGSIQGKLVRAYSPVYIEVVNESHLHSVPADSETHFRVVVVSAHFATLTRVQRSRDLHAVLAEELKPGRVHALSSRLLTPEEWQGGQGEGFNSPPCASS